MILLFLWRYSLLIVLSLIVKSSSAEQFFNKDSSQFEQEVHLSKFSNINNQSFYGKFLLADWSDLPYRDDDLSNFWEPFLKNCTALLRDTSSVSNFPKRLDPNPWKTICSEATCLLKKSAPNETEVIKEFLKTHFEPWILVDEDCIPIIDVMTGYYEPILEGSRFKTDEFKWPIYGTPNDLLTIDLGSVYPELVGKRIRGKLDGKRVIPYDDRASIYSYRTDIPVLIWTADPISNFFFQVQGSGKIILVDGPDYGEIIRLSYANHNGHQYKSIGKWLAANGEMPIHQTSEKNIRLWAQNNSNRLKEMLNFNPSVIFFQESKISDFALGPIGSYGVSLTPERSVAVDTLSIPLGSLLFISEFNNNNADDIFPRFVFAQDTGEAIKGTGRMDLYLGFGKKAEYKASTMKKNIQIWVLWPKNSNGLVVRK